MHAVKNVDTYDFIDYKTDRYLIFDGTITENGPMRDYSEALSRHKIKAKNITDGNNGMLIPGLVLGHTHIYSAFARGMSLPFDPSNFLELLRQLWWKMDAALDNDMTYYSALVSSMGYVKSGVTTVIDHHASGREIRGSLKRLKRAVVEETGLRGVFCFETSDRFDVDRCIRENIDFRSECVKEKCGSLFGLHASMTLSDATLDKVKQVIGGQPIHIHVAESAMDEDDSRNKYNLSVIERLDRFGLLNENSLIVHGIYLSDTEMDILLKRGCYIALNALSNLNNGVGLPDYRAMKKHGLKCIIGNDGLGTGVVNEWQTLLFSMHHRYRDPVSFGLDDLNRIILNGYEYVNKILDTRLGRLEKGFNSDFILLDETNPTPINGKNALGHLVFGSGFNFRPSHVWCGGEIKLRNYKIVHEDTIIFEKSRKLSAALWKEIAEE